MKGILIGWFLSFAPGILPAQVPVLNLPADLAVERRELIDRSLQELAAHPNVPYRYAAASPSEGMDCSGAIYYLLRLVGSEPPRSSAAQYEWVKAAGNLTPVPPDAQNLGHPAFAKLQPGDLIFWAPAAPDIATAPKVSHVQIYLGREARDGFPVMIGSSEGRSYRGKKQFGFSVVDFRIPRAGSYKPMIGYGPPVWRTGRLPRRRKGAKGAAKALIS